MIQSDKKVKENKVVHIYNDAEPIEGCTKFYACIWFTDHSGMFYSYIYAKDRAEAFNKAVEYLTSTKSINYVDSISISDASKL